MVELPREKPEAALTLFADVAGLRLLVVGGDGTVGWVLSCVDRLAEEKKRAAAERRRAAEERRLAAEERRRRGLNPKPYGFETLKLQFTVETLKLRFYL